MVTTPAGDPVAMVHCNNFLGDIDAWVKLFGDAAKALGANVSTAALYDTLYEAALKGDADCGGLMACNYISGEHVTGFTDGRPLFMRMPAAGLTLPNFMRAHLNAACASLHIGMRILSGERVSLDSIMGHGGFFKTPLVGQRVMASALGAPVNVMATASEGGPWGMAILAAYMMNGGGAAFDDYLADKVFAGAECTTVKPEPADVAGYAAFIKRYEAGLAVERAAVEALRF